MRFENNVVIKSILVVIIACGQAESYLTDQGFDGLRYMNLSADPCENFYEYTCGNFKNFYPLEDGDVLIDQFSLLEESLVDVVTEILKSKIKRANSVALRKAKTAYRACLDYTFIDSIGMVYPEVEVVRKYGGFPVIGELKDKEMLESAEPFGWNQIADIAAEFGISMFLTPSLYFDTQNASRNLLRISADSMDIPVQFRPKATQSYEEAIEEGFMAMADQSDSTNKRLKTTEKPIPAMEILLRKLVLKLKRILGSDRSDEDIFERVANISNFMKGIYNGGYIPDGTIVGPITNDTSTYVVTLKELNDWTYQHFGDSVQLDWVEYVKRLLQYTHVEVDENFLILQPSRLSGLNEVLYGVLNWVRMNDEEIVKSAALLRAFVYTASDSDSETRYYFEEYLKATKKTVFPRWKYCSRKIVDATGTLSLGLAVTYEYQRKYFNTSKLQNALSLINNLQSTFKEVIEETNWMDDESKAAALVKANNIVTLLGYPQFLTQPELLDDFYQNLEITTWNHYENAKKLRAFKLAYTLNMLSQRVRTAWEKSPFDANAYYNRQNNRIIFPVAMLNPIFFEGSTSTLDYSRIGMIVAHEITHGFDSQGRLYNPEGVIEAWWTNETTYNFATITQCFVDQYSNYSMPEINAQMNGSGSLNENLADNGGLRTAFKTFKKLLSTFTGQKSMRLRSAVSQQFSAEQMFFVGYGTMWCNTESIEYLTALQKSCDTTTNCHARSDMRVNGVVSNMEEFAEAFSCPVGSAMNPANKCRLW